MKEQPPFTYLALGDSYTIGEAVDPNESWPFQLVKKLQNTSIKINEPTIVAKTGWTTNELLDGIRQRDLHTHYDLVTLLIGVNNQYRKLPIGQYINEFEKLLSLAIKFAGNDSNKVIVVSIPDYGVTQFSIEKNLNTQKIGNEIDKYNNIALEISEYLSVDFIDITHHSKLAAKDLSLTTHDKLHPSEKMYKYWVEKVFPKAKIILNYSKP